MYASICPPWMTRPRRRTGGSDVMKVKKKRTDFLRTGIFFLLLGAMVFLSLALPEDLFPKREQGLIQISVLLGEWDGALWSNTRSGMDQAAEDLGAELRYISPQSVQESEDQSDLMMREISGGTDAVIIRPADPDKLIQALSTQATYPPVVTLDSHLTGMERACVGVDSEEIGRALALEVVEDYPKGGTALLIRPEGDANAAAQRMAAAEQVLEQAGFTVMTCRKPAGLDAQEDQPSLVESADFIMVFETGALEQTAQTLRSWEITLPLYGAGSSATIAGLMEQGYITAIAAWSDYAAGYLAVERAVGAARNGTVDDSKIQFQIVRKEEMYEPEIQKLLFPVSG